MERIDIIDKICKRGHVVIEKASNGQCKICKRANDRKYLYTELGFARRTRSRVNESIRKAQKRVERKKKLLGNIDATLL